MHVDMYASIGRNYYNFKLQEVYCFANIYLYLVVTPNSNVKFGYMHMLKNYI